MLKIVLCACLLTAAQPLRAQAAATVDARAEPASVSTTPVSTLYPGGATGVASVTAQAIILPVRCDASGGVYFRTYQPGDTRRGVIGISADGRRVVHYDLPDTPAYKEATITDFFLNQDGKVVMPVQTGDKASLLVFDDRGKVDETTPIQDTAFITHVAAFGNGYLIMGHKGGDSNIAGQNGRPTQREYAAVFDDSGRLVKQLASPARSEPDPASDGENANRAAKSDASDREAAFLKASPVTGANGNVYLLHPDSPPSLSEINSSGETVHRFALTEPEAGFRASQFLPTPEKMAVVFLKTTVGQNDSALILVLNATGDETRRYAVAPDLIGTPACFDGRDFTFLGNADGHVVLRRAVAR
jgi:hypothetical protein